MTTSTPLLRLKTAIAPKTGMNANGGITYAVLCSAKTKEIFFYLLGNSGGGYFSREAVPLVGIQRCLDGVATDCPCRLNFEQVYRLNFDQGQ